MTVLIVKFFSSRFVFSTIFFILIILNTFWVYSTPFYFSTSTTFEKSIRSPVVPLLNPFRWANLKNKKSFKIYIEKSLRWAQSHSCSFNRLEMAWERKQGIHFQEERKMPILLRFAMRLVIGSNAVLDSIKCFAKLLMFGATPED